MKLRFAVLLALVVAACGAPEDGSRTSSPVEPSSTSICQAFIDATEDLHPEMDTEAFAAVVNPVSVPIFEYLLDEGLELPNEVILGWENLAYGQPNNNDLEAVHYTGGELARHIGVECEELGRNIGEAPVSVVAEPAPEVSVTPIYPVGTVDYFCDVFIQTMAGWSEARSSGGQIGLDIAQLSRGLAADLEGLGITAGVADLRGYASLYETRPIIEAHESAEHHLWDASDALSEHSVVCAHLSPHLHDHPDDLAYHQFRWEALGYDDYVMRLRLVDNLDARRESDFLVVVERGQPNAVFDIRTGEEVEPPLLLPLTIDEMFSRVHPSDHFDPVFGYPTGAGPVGLLALTEGTEFDSAILGSAADPKVTVVAVPEFVPGKRCGPATIAGGQEIPETFQPLDDDALAALEILAANAEGSRFVESYEYGMFARTDDTLTLLGDDGAGNLAYAYFEMRDGEWAPHNFGTCHWEDDGYRMASWTPDPEAQVEGASDTVHILAADECQSHARFGNEYLVVAHHTSESVELTVWRAINPPPPPEGPEIWTSDCPYGGPVQITVILDQPIGDRELIGDTPPSEWPDF